MVLLRTRALRNVPGRSGETNVALAANGGVATASSFYNHDGNVFDPSGAINGDRGGVGWATSGGWNDDTPGAWPDWLQVNFNGWKSINRVVVFTKQDSGTAEPGDATTFTLEGATDYEVRGWNGGSWVTLATVAGNNLVKRTLTFSAFTTDRIRIHVTGGLSNFARLVEVEAYGVEGTPVYQVGALNKSFDLITPNTGTLPWSLAHTFADGDVSFTDGVAFTGATAQFVPLAQHPSGFVRLAQISGTSSFTANTPLTIGMAIGTASTGTTITTADITAAAPEATFEVVGTGTAALSSLYGSPARTWATGHKMIDAQYRVDFAGREVTFYVQHHAAGRTFIEVVAANGFLGSPGGSLAAQTTLTGRVIITIGGVTKYDSGSSVNHYPNTRPIHAEGWIGGDPQVTPRHNTAYMRASFQAPNYKARTLTDAAMNGLYHGTYQPFNVGGIGRNMGDSGWAEHVGLLPKWDAAFLSQEVPDKRVYEAVLNQGKALNCFRIDWRNSTSRDIIKLSDFANWTIGGPGANATDPTPMGSGGDFVGWEGSHHPGCYLPYILTGRRFFYETMMFNAGMAFLTTNWNNGLTRIPYTQDRGTAWNIRDAGYGAAFGRTGDAAANEYKLWCENIYGQINTFRTTSPRRYTSLIGIERMYPDNFGADPDAVSLSPYQNHRYELARWQNSYMSMAHCGVAELAPIGDMSAINGMRDAVCKLPVLLSGVSGDTTQYPFTKAANYTVTISTSNLSTDPDYPLVMANNGGDVHAYTHGTLNNTATNVLEGVSASTPAGASDSDVGWGVHMMALAMAVDARASGAVEGWRRLIGASNFSDTQAGFNTTPNWGVEPRIDVALPSWRTAMAPLDVHTFSGSEPWSQAGFASGSEATAWFAYSGGAVHQASSTLVCIGSGHSDGYRNWGWGFRFNKESPDWYQVTYATAFADIGWSGSAPGSTHYSDGRPAARHTYGGLSCDETNGRIILHTAKAVYGNGNGGGQDVDALDINAGDYVAANTYTPWPVDPGVAGDFAIGANDEMWLLAPGGHLYRWKPSTGGNGAPGVITDFGDKGFAAEYEVAHGIHQTREVFFRIGNVAANIPSAWFDLAASGASHAFTLAGDSAAVTDLRNNRHWFVYDEGLDCMWAWRRQTSTPTLYRIDITGTKPSLTFTVGAAVTLNGAIDAPSDVGNMGYGRFAYIRSLRGIGWVAGGDKPVRFIATSNFT